MGGRGRGTTLSKSAQDIEQTVGQSDNPAQGSRQDQETVRTRSYTVTTESGLKENRVSANDDVAGITNVQIVRVEVESGGRRAERERLKLR